MVIEDIVSVLREEHAEEKQLGNDFLADVIWKAADEIERLRKIIKAYYKADEEYRQEMQSAHDSDEIMEVILRIEWKKAWNELEQEALRGE